MILQKLPPFLNVVATGVATLRIPRYAQTLTRLVLKLGGTFTKTMITDIKIKAGVRIVYNTTGLVLDAINTYKGLTANASYLTLDFTERDATGIVGREIGGYDLQTMDDLTLEVTIAGATSPTLEATAYFTPPQNNPLIQKILSFQVATSASGKLAIPFDPRGALIKRIHMKYAGTDWGASTDGNINRLEVKKNGLVIFDQTCTDNRFAQNEYRKVPQSKYFVYDPIVDNNASGHLVTADAASLEFNAYLTAGDTVNVYAELLDAPNNA